MAQGHPWRPLGVVALLASAACTSGLDEFEVASGSGTSASSSGSGGASSNGSGGAGASGTGAASGTGGATGGGGSGGATATATGTGGTGGVAGGGGVGGVAGGGGMAGMGGGGPTENCLDGLDNDGNGLSDCADPACMPGFECVDDAPLGWAGYVRIRTTSLPTPLSPCPDGSMPLTFMDTPAGDAQCTACTCGAWSGGACGPAQLKCWDGSTSCNGGAPLDISASDFACHNAPNVTTGTNRSCKVTADGAVTDPGACPPSAVDFPNKASFANQDDICGGSAVGSGCGGAKVCVPKGGGDYTGEICIQKVGIDGCPGGWPNKIQAYSGAMDDRGCDACTCGVGGTTCTGGVYTVFDANNCDLSDPGQVNVGTTCVDVTQLLDNGTGSAIAVPATASGGSCTAGGGAAHGGVTPQNPVSFCCK